MKLPRRWAEAFRTGRWWLVLAAGGTALGLAGAVAKTAAPPAPHDTMVLPPMMVEARTAPLNWRYLETPGLQLLSVCSDATTITFARREYQLRELLRVLIPDRYLFQAGGPERHILFDEEIGRAHSREVLAEMAQRDGGRVTADGTVAPRGLPGAIFGQMGGLNLPTVSFLPNMRLWDPDSTMVFAIIADDGQPLQFSFTEDRIEFLLQRRAPTLPDWLVEGMLGVYRVTTFNSKNLEVAPVPWTTEDRRVRRKAAPTLLPLRELFAGGRPRPGEAPTEADRRWREQCTLLVHWAVTGPAVRRDALWRWVDALEKQPPDEARFEACFGFGFREAGSLLSEYLDGEGAETVRLKAPPAESLGELAPRPATPLEIARIRGDWERLEIDYVRQRYPEVVDKYVAQARTTLHRAYDAGERDARLLVALALTEFEARNFPEATRLLEAVPDGQLPPRGRLALARLRYAALPAEGLLDAAQAETVLGVLRPAWRELPPLLENYVIAAVAWRRCERVPDAATLAELQRGCRLFPRVSSYVIQVIAFTVAAGDLDTARELTELGAREARDPAPRASFTRVRAELAMASGK